MVRIPAKMKRLLVIVILIAGISGCITEERCSRKYPSVAVKDSVFRYDSIIEKLVPQYITDSTAIMALLECDSLGMIRVKSVEDYYAGRLVQVPEILIRDNYITAKCRIDSGAVMMKLLEKYVNQVRVVVQQKPPITTNILKGYQVFLIWTGGIMLVVLLSFLAFMFFKLK